MFQFHAKIKLKHKEKHGILNIFCAAETNMETEIFQRFFSAETATEHGMLIPSVESHLQLLGCTNFYVGWERAIQESVLDRLPGPYVKQKFLETLGHVNKAHLTYHHEPYGWHALCCGLICSHDASAFAQGYGISPKIAFLLGFLHDIGKPFTETRSGKTYMHGQIGVHLAEGLFADLDPELRQVLLFLIDQHMCVCTHTPEERHHICFATLQSMIASYSEKQQKLYGSYYRCLVYGDRLGAWRPDIHLDMERVKHIESSTVQYILQGKPLTPPVGPGNMFLVMHGAPGCGKSTMAARFMEALSGAGLTVGVAERDQAYWIVARKQKLAPLDLSFEDFVEKTVDVGWEEGPNTYYKHVYPLIKTQIAEHYRNIVLDAAEKYDVVILDSCVSLNPKVLGDFISAEDNMYVWTGFPQHLLGRKGSYKVEEQSVYPLDQESAYYRSAVEIYRDPESVPTPLVASSCFQELYNLVVASWRVKLERGVEHVGEQVYPSVAINTDGLAEFKRRNPMIVVDEGLKFYKHPSYRVIRLSYYDGKQHGNGSTLHYRGEHLIQDPVSSMWVPLRVSLPVTPETSQLRKFQSHAELYGFVKPLKKYLACEFTEPRTHVDPGIVRYNRCFVLPKVDGSLMNVSAVKAQSVQGTYIRYLKEHHDVSEFYREIDDVIYYVGSKSCLFATQASSVVEPFKAAVIASYGSFDRFYQHVHEHLREITWEETASVVFEAVPEHPYWGLTVDYGRSFVSHLATVYYKGEGVKIKLPCAESAIHLHAAPVEEIPCSAEALAMYYEKKMEEALQGSVEDLEGFMLAFTEPAGGLLYMKLKFPWYYAAHKPDIHYQEAERLYVDPKYARIKDRLFGLQVAVHAAELKKNPGLVFEEYAGLLIQCFDKFKKAGDSRKDFMIRLFAAEVMPHEDELEDAFKAIISKFYIKAELNLHKHIASLYDVLAQEGNDKSKKVAAITTFYIKLLKL
jgi:hypothetical protein